MTTQETGALMPLTKHSIVAMRMLKYERQPRITFNPGVVDRLLRSGLARIVLQTSPFRSHSGGSIEHLEITADGLLALAGVKP